MVEVREDAVEECPGCSRFIAPQGKKCQQCGQFLTTHQPEYQSELIGLVQHNAEILKNSVIVAWALEPTAARTAKVLLARMSADSCPEQLEVAVKTASAVKTLASVTAAGPRRTVEITMSLLESASSVPSVSVLDGVAKVIAESLARTAGIIADALEASASAQRQMTRLLGQPVSGGTAISARGRSGTTRSRRTMLPAARTRLSWPPASQ